MMFAPTLHCTGFLFLMIMKKEIPTNKDGWASSFAFPAYVWPIIKALPNESRLRVFDCICRYGIEGEKYSLLDPLEDGVLDCAYMQMEEFSNIKKL